MLVYRVDPRFPERQQRAEELVLALTTADSARIAHQAVVEFVSATTRSTGGAQALLTPDLARAEAEDLLAQFEVFYPTEALVRLALRGAAAYQLSWYDAHMWAYAEYYGCTTLWSEDFSHERSYGTVTTRNPFVD